MSTEPAISLGRGEDDLALEAEQEKPQRQEENQGSTTSPGPQDKHISSM